MHQYSLRFIVAMVFTIAGTVHGQDLVESITVLGNGTIANGSVTLDAGVLYDVTASGTISVSGTLDGTTRGADQSGLADAEYVNFDNPIDAINGIDVGIALNGNDTDWGPYASDHMYTARITGTGAPLEAEFRDTFAGDNSGSFELVVRTVIPEPATAMLLLPSLMVARRRRP